jgi:hypothetical protein
MSDEATPIPGPDESIKTIDIKEFRELGFLQEVNRCFFHPLGLALSVKVNEDGTEQLDSVWDYREDPEGITFGTGMIDRSKMDYVFNELQKHSEHRAALFGGRILQLPEDVDE